MRNSKRQNNICTKFPFLLINLKTLPMIVVSSISGGKGPVGRRRRRRAGNVSSYVRGLGVADEWIGVTRFCHCGHGSTNSEGSLSKLPKFFKTSYTFLISLSDTEATDNIVLLNYSKKTSER